MKKSIVCLALLFPSAAAVAQSPKIQASASCVELNPVAFNADGFSHLPLNLEIETDVSKQLMTVKIFDKSVIADGKPIWTSSNKDQKVENMSLAVLGYPETGTSRYPGYFQLSFKSGVLFKAYTRVPNKEVIPVKFTTVANLSKAPFDFQDLPMGYDWILTDLEEQNSETTELPTAAFDVLSYVAKKLKIPKPDFACKVTYLEM